ncbi:hypothetical protein L873DRAFT_1155599 [Choiromyces venosus 120613-1]|uniref:Uncharacterized protein n=1 Tax=Choiromyces venosus 120613-1 TaxID=1336337 RepID=A0A3N4JFN2_9PEZI|nr:hypothetical protein L873DRAFT_1155599 [Choiromyces venosus 120613-1]
MPRESTIADCVAIAPPPPSSWKQNWPLCSQLLPPMTPDELSELLLLDEYLVLDIPPAEFPELEQVIGRRAYTYRPAVGQLTIKMATEMNGTVLNWPMDLIMAGTEAGAFGKHKLQLLSKARLSGFKIKVPDVTIVPTHHLWPTVAFEFGYAEPYHHLKNDMKLLLEGSEGKISNVIIIKLESLKEGETQIQRGFVEMWHFVNGHAQRDGGRKVTNLFPPPRTHEEQRLELTLGDILRDEFVNVARCFGGGLTVIIMENLNK